MLQQAILDGTVGRHVEGRLTGSRDGLRMGSALQQEFDQRHVAGHAGVVQRRGPVPIVRGVDMNGQARIRRVRVEQALDLVRLALNGGIDGKGWRS